MRAALLIAPHPALLGPFAVLLLSIAIFPLILRQRWERHYQKLCALLAATTCGYYVFALRGAARVQHAAGEYASFVVVVGAFFVVAGAIHLHIPRPASPLANVMLLFGGSVLANLIGTIGASMLLLRPFLHMNRGRGTAMHVAFFIFIVGNLGGALLPVGPPLFLGYMKGVPFLWAALHCWPQWLTATGALLVIFFVADTIACSRSRVAEAPSTHFHCYGKWNFGALLTLLFILVFVPNGVREPLMVAVAAVSYFLTPRRVFEANEFSWRPLIEVAWIFLGIFGTMIPVLDYVEFHAPDFRLASDARFYWGTGLLSGVLDNAPTYLTFLTAALSLDHFDINHLPDVVQFASGHGSRLAAISVAATFFGGLTYIGNSPNLLIRAIAESRHVPAPGFLAYIIKYALPILVPVLALVGLIFFRG
jgi:Na+/H+ antiporter NhaD/arsenite permease-like protein